MQRWDVGCVIADYVCRGVVNKEQYVRKKEMQNVQLEEGKKTKKYGMLKRLLSLSRLVTVNRSLLLCTGLMEQMFDGKTPLS